MHGLEGIREAEVCLKPLPGTPFAKYDRSGEGLKIKVAVVHGLGNAKKIVVGHRTCEGANECEALYDWTNPEDDGRQYDFVEVGMQRGTGLLSAVELRDQGAGIRGAGIRAQGAGIRAQGIGLESAAGLRAQGRGSVLRGAVGLRGGWGRVSGLRGGAEAGAGQVAIRAKGATVLGFSCLSETR